MDFKFKSDERTAMLPLLDAYLATEFARSFTAALEIGVYKGGWLTTLASNNSSILTIGIDPYPNLEVIKNSLIEYRNKIGLKERLFIYSSFNELLNSTHNQITYDMIHLDWEHSQSGVSKDLKHLHPLLNDNGILIIDDIFYHSYPGVTAAAFSFIEKNSLTPFLFTEKKLYICDRRYYKEYYTKTISALNLLRIDYEESQNSTSKAPYIQSNSIFGSNLIITSEKLSRREKANVLKVINHRLPMTIRTKNTFRIFTPPILLELFQFFKTRLKLD